MSFIRAHPPTVGSGLPPIWQKVKDAFGQIRRATRMRVCRDYRERRLSKGVTLIELLIAIAVFAVLVAAAIPSFQEFRDRSGLRGAADQVVSFWGDARFEALRRNSLIKVGFVEDSGAFCLGAATSLDPSDDEPCDCFSVAGCDVAAYPQNQADWRGVRVASAATLGDGEGVAVIDPKRASLTEVADAGRILLRSAGRSSFDYRLSIAVDRNARAVICEPSDAGAKLPQYIDRRC
jgi:prepilin-type N-terminal cleavage/methylation domain-containing protein